MGCGLAGASCRQGPPGPPPIPPRALRRTLPPRPERALPSCPERPGLRRAPPGRSPDAPTPLPPRESDRAVPTCLRSSAAPGQPSSVPPAMPATDASANAAPLGLNRASEPCRGDTGNVPDRRNATITSGGTSAYHGAASIRGLADLGRQRRLPSRPGPSGSRQHHAKQVGPPSLHRDEVS